MYIQYRVVRNSNLTLTIQYLEDGHTIWLPLAGRSTFYDVVEAIKVKELLEDEQDSLKARDMISEIIDPPRREKKRKKEKEK